MSRGKPDSSEKRYPNLVWLRNDIRLDDNPALSQALSAGPSSGSTQVVFVSTLEQWLMHNEPSAQLGLKADLLTKLAANLTELGIPFTELSADMFADIPALLVDYCRQQHIQHVFFNGEAPLDEKRRDVHVKAALASVGVEVSHLGYDMLVSAPVMNQQGEPYKVFTPYYKNWLRVLNRRFGDEFAKPLPAPSRQGPALNMPPLELLWRFDYRDDLWSSDEADVLSQLRTFCENKLDDYKQARDFPALDATSALSPYLAAGVLGPRRLIHEIQHACPESWQEDDWLRELAWRDFYRQLLVHFPELNKGKAFKPETESIEWQNDIEKFQCWCDGKTGFPIIDAAMRQLNDTGWMHNRLRMLVASFLTKLLFIDWRWGEAHFMRTLIDGDFASNNGGWQWSASTGCDASPYFRVFNPERQSRQFDAQGDFIRQYVPELMSLDDKSIHNPKTEHREYLGYPQPIVDYASARTYAIETFKNLK